MFDRAHLFGDVWHPEQKVSKHQNILIHLTHHCTHAHAHMHTHTHTHTHHMKKIDGVRRRRHIGEGEEGEREEQIHSYNTL